MADQDEERTVFITFRATPEERAKLQMLGTRCGGRSKLLRKLVAAELAKYPGLQVDTKRTKAAARG